MTAPSAHPPDCQDFTQLDRGDEERQPDIRDLARTHRYRTFLRPVTQSRRGQCVDPRGKVSEREPAIGRDHIGSMYFDNPHHCGGQGCAGLSVHHYS
jgi:hypothetical protein